jgi:hypothetical protein
MKHAKELKRIAETKIPKPSKEGIWDMEGPKLLAAQLQKKAEGNRFMMTVFLEKYVSGTLDETDLANALQHLGYRVTKSKTVKTGGKCLTAWDISWGHS